MNVRTGFSIAAALCVASSFAIVEATSNISWSPKKGDVIKYDSVATFPGHQMGEMEVHEMITNKITSVSSAKVTIQETAEMKKILADGSNVTDSMPKQEVSPRTLTFNALGTCLSREGIQTRVIASPRLERVMSFVYPKNDVKPGDSWTLKLTKSSGANAVEGKLTYIGEENLHGKKAYKIRAEVAELDVAEVVAITRTIWLSVEDGHVIRSEAKVKNMPMPHDMDPVSATITLQQVK